MPENIVYFLGAGFSKNFGYPLTGDIMPKILHGLRQQNLFKIGLRKTQNEIKQESYLLDYMHTLYPGLQDKDADKDKDEIPSIIEVLSMVDHCCFYNTPPHPKFDDATLQHFRQLLNRAVGELLLTYDLTDYTKYESNLLEKFIEGTTLNDDTINNISIITTNYDLIIDTRFKHLLSSYKVDLGIPFRNVSLSKLIMQPNEPKLRYYKLHGSMNWAKCDLCGQYYVNPKGSIIHNAFKDEISDSNTCICSDTLRLKSVLIAPSLVRDIRDSNLLQIWKGALEAIRTADKIVFIGYSLPAEDLAIKSIIMRGLNGRDKEKKLTVDVVQLGNTSKPNYENIFRKKINFHADGLEEYLN